MKSIILIFVSVFITFSSILGQGENRYQLLFEGGSYGEDIKLFDYQNWYGIYLTDSGEFLKKININYQLQSDPIKDVKNPTYVGNYIFWTDNQESSYLIIGTNKELIDHRVSFHGSKFFSRTNVIYPGQRRDLYTINNLPHRKSFKLSALGCVDSYNFAMELSNYKLQISTEREKWKSQIISKHLDFKGETGLIDLKWFGDIDFDGIPDLLLMKNSTAESWMYLFLSSEATDNEYVKLVSKVGSGN